MKMIVYDNSGHPFQVQLSRSLAKCGYDVLHLYSASFQTPKGALQKTADDSECFNIKGLSLAEPFKKYSFIKRWKQENQFGKLVTKEIKNFKPDSVIASNVPLDTLRHVLTICKKNNIKFIFWVQDFYGIAIKNILQRKLPLFGQFIGYYYISLEKRILNKSDHIILISHHFVDVLKRMKVGNQMFTVIPNWAPIDDLHIVDKKNDWSITYKLDSSFCFMYTGTLGFKHKPELLIKLATRFKGDEHIRIVVVSEGLGTDWLTKKKVELILENLVIFHFQPFETLSRVMGTADVLVSILEKDAGIYSVPSKILSYMCAGRPLLLSVPHENLASAIVEDAQGGIVVDPQNENEFIEAAEKLYYDENLRKTQGKNARIYAEKFFNIDIIKNKFVGIIT